MTVYDYKIGMSLGLGKTVVALGLFDGVHKGHKKLLDSAMQIAREQRLPFAVFTFRDKYSALKGGERLFTDEERQSIIEELGVEHLIVADFSDMMQLSAADFVEKTLVRDLDTAVAVVGDDFRFGHGREGDVKLLDRLLFEKSRRLYCEPSVNAKNGEKLSSASIKKLIADGNVSLARELLCSAYFIEERVEKGIGLGHRLGIPTVNISLQNKKLAPKRGVYATAVKIDEKIYTGLTNVGTCPTFGERKEHTETFILGFSSALYGKRLRVYFLEYLRPEKKFESQDELLKQIKLDTDRTLKLTERIKWQEIGIN